MIVEDGRIALTGDLVDEFGRFVYGQHLTENGLVAWPVAAGGGGSLSINVYDIISRSETLD